MTSVAAVIVTYNPDLPSWEEALAAHAESGTDLVVVVDNGSANAPELSAALAAARLPAARFLPQPKNLGIAAAQNLGIAEAAASGCSHVMLFDQDSLPPARLARELLAEEARLLARGEAVAAVGPAFSDPRSGSRYPQMRLRGALLTKVWPQKDSDPLEVSFIIASGSLIRMEVLNRVGTMREDLFIDCVDLEWCFRAGALGLKSFVSSRATMSHTIGDRRRRSLGREISIHSPLRRYYIARNSILLARLPWVPLGYKVRELFCVLTRSPVFLCAVGFERSYVKHMCRGIVHGLAGRGGEYA